MRKLRMILLCGLVALVMFPVTLSVLAKGGADRRPVASVHVETITLDRFAEPAITCVIDCDGDGPPYDFHGSVASVDVCLYGLCAEVCGSPCT